MRKEKDLLAAMTMPTVQPTIRPGRQMGNYGKILLPPGAASVTLGKRVPDAKKPTALHRLWAYNFTVNSYSLHQTQSLCGTSTAI
jgi:hypothetical protein